RTEGFFTVYLPQSLAGIGSAATLVYILSLGAYVIPQTLGATRGLMFAQMLVDQATTLLNWNMAAAMAVVMLLAAAVPALLLAMVRRVMRAAWKNTQVAGGVGYWLRAHVQPVLNAAPARLWTLAWLCASALVLA